MLTYILKFRFYVNLNLKTGGIVARFERKKKLKLVSGLHPIFPLHLVSNERRLGFSFSGWIVKTIIEFETSEPQEVFEKMSPVFGEIHLPRLV